MPDSIKADHKRHLTREKGAMAFMTGFHFEKYARFRRHSLARTRDRSEDQSPI